MDALTSPPWSPVWDKLRSEQGLTCSGFTRETYPIMPVPAIGRGWSQSALGVTAAGEWLRNLLRRTETVGDIRLATHSCKATLLSWCSKAHLSHDDRRLLGYHTSSSDASMLVYSRDAMLGPLRSLCRIISQVVSGEFSPDATRSGLFLSRHDGLSDEVSEISSVGSEDEDDADLFEEEKAVEDVGGRWQPNDIPDGFVYFRHLSSRCIHKTLNESGSLFACGRSISTRYERQAERPKFFHPLCGSCFKDYHA